ncbi:MAG: hypothetical protein WAL63_09620 [Solirubrobacteraceae bacterium]
MAIGRSLTLGVTQAQVNSASGMSARTGIVVTSIRRPAYTLSGDSARHPECVKAGGCFQIWPPITVSSTKSLSKAAGVKGKVGTWRRNGFLQVTLNGHPLYRYAGDTEKLTANGDGIRSFGGIWHVIKESTSSPGATTPTTTSGPTSTSPPPGY